MKAGLAMPKKKATRPKGSTPPSEPDRSLTNRALRMTQEYADWLERASTHDRRSIAAFIDMAVAQYAKTIGFAEEPPPRL